MNTESIDMRRIERPLPWTWNGAEDKPKPGDFQIHPGGEMIHMVLPGGSLCSIPIKKGRKEEHAWHWDGNDDKPTLSPSVDHYSHDSKGNKHTIWHGHIVKGRMVSC